MRTLIAHLGLGDAILLSGAAVVLAKRYDGLRFPSYEHNLISVRAIFVNHPEIEVFPVAYPPGSIRGVPPLECFDVKGDVIKCGYYHTWRNRSDISFPELFYQQLDVPYVDRWDSCPVKAAAFHYRHTQLSDKFTGGGEPLSFVHDDPSRGYKITKLLDQWIDAYDHEYSYEHSDPNILNYSYIIESAEQIHCIDSSFYHLIDSLEPTGKLFLHRYAKYYIPGWCDYPTRQQWTIVE